MKDKYFEEMKGWLNIKVKGYDQYQYAVIKNIMRIKYFFLGHIVSGAYSLSTLAP